VDDRYFSMVGEMISLDIVADFTAIWIHYLFEEISS